MENNYLPPANCNLHGKKDWKEKQTLVAYPPHIPLVIKNFYVPASLQLQFDFVHHTRVLPWPLTINLILPLIRIAEGFQGLFDSLEKGGVL